MRQSVCKRAEVAPHPIKEMGKLRRALLIATDRGSGTVMTAVKRTALTSRTTSMIKLRTEKFLTCRLIDPLDPLGAPRPRLERVTEVLRLAKDNGMGWLPSITDDMPGNPKIGVPNRAPNGEVLVGKQPPRRPDGEPTTDALAGLGILQQGFAGRTTCG